MKKIFILLLLALFGTVAQGCGQSASNSPIVASLTQVENPISEEKDDTIMNIKVTANGNTTVFQLNNSTAAKELFEQLPLSVAVEDFSTNEKIFYPPQKLNTAKTPTANAQTGTLAYYAPWGNVVMFYARFGSAAGLYDLGKAVSGNEHIQNMSGTIKIEKVTAQ